MDRVRFGRALGYGARHAAKTLAEAANAAASKPPATARPAASPGAAGQPTRAAVAARAVVQARQGSKQLKQSMWAPLRTFSSVLWLEVTGCFFALIALFMGEGLWKVRAALKASPSTSEAQKAYLYAAVFALFAYFTVSSFVRANRRGKQERRTGER